MEIVGGVLVGMVLVIAWVYSWGDSDEYPESGSLQEWIDERAKD